MTNSKGHGAKSKGQGERGRWPEEASGTSHACERTKTSGCRRRSGRRERGRLLVGRKGVSPSQDSSRRSSSRSSHRDLRGGVLRGEDKGLRQAPTGGDGRNTFPPGVASSGNYIRGGLESPLPESSGAFCDSSLPSRLQSGDHGGQVRAWPEGQASEGRLLGRRLVDQPRKGGRRPARKRRLGGAETERTGVGEGSPSCRSQEEERGGVKRRSQGQKEEEKGKEEEEVQRFQEGKEETGGLGGRGLLEFEAERAPSPGGVDKEVEKVIRRGGPGHPRESQEKGELPGSKVPQERSQREELFQWEFHQRGDQQSPRGGPQRWSVLGDFKGEVHCRKVPWGFGSGGTSGDEGAAVAGEGRRFGSGEPKADSSPLLPPTVVEAAERAGVAGGSHIGNSHRLPPEGSAFSCHGCHGSEAEVNRGFGGRSSLAGLPTHGDCTAGAKLDCKGSGTQRSTEGDLRGGQDPLALKPSPRWEGEGQGPGWEVRQERRRKERRKGRERSRQAERAEREEVRAIHGNGGEENSRAPAGELLDDYETIDGTVASVAGKGIADARMVGSPPGTVVEPNPVLFTRPSVTTTDVGFSNADGTSGIPPHSGKSGEDVESMLLEQGSLCIKGVGVRVLQKFLEVLPLRSKSTGSGQVDSLFPVPTSRTILQSLYPSLDQCEISWFCCICLGLNSFWGGDLFNEGSPTVAQSKSLDVLVEDVLRLRSLSLKLDDFDWGSFFRTRSVDYQGDEVKIALQFKWENISPALPKEVGVVPLEEVCQHGARYYVENFDLFLKDKSEWSLVKPPKVMVNDDDWPAVCSGLCQAGVCTLLTREEIFDTGDGPLLNGLFGVTKDETNNGYEVYRLIMNLIPLNGLCQSLSGDVSTLPAWSTMSPFFLQPTENLLVSSEDVRCFFYVMSVPSRWYKFLAFNKPVPDCCLPEHLKGFEVYLASRVLPMGFLNSVALAQHVHRNLCLWSGSSSGVNAPAQELRKDKQFPSGQNLWRIYLDNYDLLEKVEATKMVEMRGTVAAPVLALKEQYEIWGIPRNAKKAASREPLAEVQGAMIDGVRGIAYPRESKLLKYIGAALKLCCQKFVSQRQMQVVCGGLVYMAMFRRPLLGGLNAVWRQIEDFNKEKVFQARLWDEARFEILRFLCFVPLARLDFRLDMHPQVTCSDASTTGGGICASTSLTKFGNYVSGAGLRGSLPEDRRDHRLLSIGLFDGIGALRVALDLLGVDVMGHISVEQSKAATRVVEASFPSVVTIPDVSLVDLAMVREWSCRFSQVSVVLLGAGPPCQGVSGLNVDRKGAMKDVRSVLFLHVKRVEGLVKECFPWCQVHSFMESVASMDVEDKATMSDSFGDTPWKCDAGTLTWSSRPRLYWLTWELTDGEGVTRIVSESEHASREVALTAFQDLEKVCKTGWIKVDSSRAFPTFTTSRPRSRPGHKPAGIHHCTDEEVARWVADSHRFPPYQYQNKNLLVNKKGDLRLPDAEEREVLLGFPVGYTANCLPKGQRKGDVHNDTRLTLLGNSWSVPVVSWFLSQLLYPLGLCKFFTPQDIVDRLFPTQDQMVSTLLFRAPLRPLREDGGSANASTLAFKLGNLVSIKGEDILLTSSPAEQVKFHRLRASVPSKLWRWKVISGWKWKGQNEHINNLELRAILTTLRWRITHKHHFKTRMIHLTDSLVCLHALTRGRSSSKRLRRTLCRINALLLASSSQVVWSYIHTDQNPADRPSRWSSKTKTKFRNA